MFEVLMVLGWKRRLTETGGVLGCSTRVEAFAESDLVVLTEPSEPDDGLRDWLIEGRLTGGTFSSFLLFDDDNEGVERLLLLKGVARRLVLTGVAEGEGQWRGVETEDFIGSLEDGEAW